MNNRWIWLAMIGALGAFSCNKKGEGAAGPMEKAGEWTDDAAEDTGDAAEDAVEETKDTAKKVRDDLDGDPKTD